MRNLKQRRKNYYQKSSPKGLFFSPPNRTYILYKEVFAIIRIGIFSGSDRDPKPVPMIIKTSGVEPSLEVIAYYASQTQKSDKPKNDEK